MNSYFLVVAALYGFLSLVNAVRSPIGFKSDVTAWHFKWSNEKLTSIGAADLSFSVFVSSVRKPEDYSERGLLVAHTPLEFYVGGGGLDYHPASACYRLSWAIDNTRCVIIFRVNLDTDQFEEKVRSLTRRRLVPTSLQIRIMGDAGADNAVVMVRDCRPLEEPADTGLLSEPHPCQGLRFNRV
ncbi:MAG: hypothetical protein M1833_003241 [Piccolia ochrophora]|nr:MAG: hypothetical protein M1833_003241 [Piccolia ochrophora]